MVAVLGTAWTVRYVMRETESGSIIVVNEGVVTDATCEKPRVYEDNDHGFGYTAGWSATWDLAISQNAEGSPVREAQCLLKYLHGITEIGETDGIFGPLTHDAVVTFQKREGLEADGVMDARTWSALRKAANT
jgi:hypothetical protein